MADHIISDDDLKILLADIALDERQQAILRRVLIKKVNTLPKAHRDAVGLAYYSALSGGEPWAIVNGTGALIELLTTSIQDAGNEIKEKDTIGRKQEEWDKAMVSYSTKDDDSQKFKAASICMRILGELGRMAYKYGNVPSAGFTIPIPGGKK